MSELEKKIEKLEKKIDRLEDILTDKKDADDLSNSQEDLEVKSKPELVEMAQELGLTGISKLRKDELIEKIIAEKTDEPEESEEETEEDEE